MNLKPINNEALVACHHLTCAYGDNIVVNDVTFSVERGEFVGIVGPSGSGKTTLLMVLAGLERADTGRIVVAGTDLTDLGEDALARFRGRNVGIVFQSRHFLGEAHALEVLLP